MGAHPETRKDMTSTFGVFLREGADDSNFRTGNLLCIPPEDDDTDTPVVLKLKNSTKNIPALLKQPLQMCLTTGKTINDPILSILCDDGSVEVLGLSGARIMLDDYDSSSMSWKVTSMREAHFCFLVIQLEPRDESTTALTLPYHRIRLVGCTVRIILRISYLIETELNLMSSFLTAG